MKKTGIIFREAPRFLALRRKEMHEAAWRVLRMTIVCGLPLSLVGLYILYRLHGDVVPSAKYIIGIPTAVLAMGFAFYVPVLMTRIPALASEFLNSWKAIHWRLKMRATK